jgi:hypothetical protein
VLFDPFSVIRPAAERQTYTVEPFLVRAILVAPDVNTPRGTEKFTVKADPKTTPRAKL